MSLLKRIESLKPTPGSTPPAPPPPGSGGTGLGFKRPVATATKDAYADLKARLQARLISELDPKMNLSEVDKMRRTILEIFDNILEQENLALPRTERSRLFEQIVAEILGLGPLEPLLKDDDITEIMVNGPRRVYIEQKNRVRKTDITFEDDEHVLRIIDRIIAPLGRRCDESQPYVDARLPDGSRVHAIIPPLSLVGPVITIRKFAKIPLTVEDLIRLGTWTPEMVAFLRACMLGKLNIVVSGGSGSGKTTLLNIMSTFIPDEERIVTMEGAAELQLRQRHVITLEARPPNIEGKGAVTIRDLVINSLRMRPDRIIVGECRSSEALDMLQAMNTGHDGSMTTVHSNSPRDTLSRLETMVLMAGYDLPVRAIREQVSRALNLIVHEERFRDGSRKVVSVTEVQGMEGDVIVLQDIFRFEQTGIEDERIVGRIKPTGVRPKFLERIEGENIGFSFDAMLSGLATYSTPADSAHTPDLTSPVPTTPGGTGLGFKRSALPPAQDAFSELKMRVQERLMAELDPKKDLAQPEKVRQTLQRLFDSVLAQENLALSRAERVRLLEQIMAEVLGLGPLEPLLSDETITEVMVNGPRQVYVERKGRLHETGITFANDEGVSRLIDRIISPLGRRCDENQPYVDARLPDGSRVNAIIPPLSLIGPVITIRKFSKIPLTIDDLIRFGTLTPELVEFIKACVQAKLNVVVSGGTGSGKTTLLNILSSFIPEEERIVTIENAAELQLRQEHVITLESRPPNVEGKGEITIRDLVINSLRMRPDRIIVGECRGPEALDMLQAMNTGHAGSMTTLHSNSPRDTLSRLETMIMMAGYDLPVRAIREQVSRALDVIVHQERFRDGTRKIVNVTEVQGMEGDVILLQDVFRFEQMGVEDGRILGRIKPTGVRPKFLERIEAANIFLPPDLFRASTRF
jgi:pilus assembly protein CpaF